MILLDEDRMLDNYNTINKLLEPYNKQMHITANIDNTILLGIPSIINPENADFEVVAPTVTEAADILFLLIPEIEKMIRIKNAFKPINEEATAIV